MTSIATNLLHDLRLGVRTAWRTPGYSAVAMLTLTLAIGANTLLFSIANPLLIRPLPLANPDRLGWIYVSHPERGVTRADASLPEFIEWREGLTSFRQLAAWDMRPATLLGHGDAKPILTSRATADLVDVWGLRPHLGRLLVPGEDAVGREPVGVLSHRFWRDEFASDPAVIGRTFTIADRATTIVGVMMPEIELGSLGDIDVWVPLPLDLSAPRDRRTVSPVGVLADGATVETADAELATFFAGQVREHPQTLSGWRPNVIDTQAALAGQDTWVILALLGVVVLFVLLIACANLANLVLTRLVARRQEIVVRFALGASRWQVVRPLLVEGLLLSVAGATGGLAIAYSGLKIVNAVAAERFFQQVAIDGYVLAFTGILAAVTPLLFTLWPALATGRRLASDTRQGTRIAGQRSARRGRDVLVASQVALALALLVVSSLAVQSMYFLRQTDLGFEPDHLLTWRFSLPDDRYDAPESRAQFARDLAAALERLPGVEAAAIASHLPVLNGERILSVSGTRHDGATGDDRPWVSWFAVSPAFFAATGIDLVTGRRFTADDDALGAQVAVLNELAASRFFDDQADALGRTLTIHDGDGTTRPVRIVGIVTDTRDGQVMSTSPQVYVPFDQWRVGSMTVVARAAGDPVSIAPGARAVMRQLDPAVAVANLKPVPQIIEEELSSTTIINGLFVSFALLALVLATAGLFAVISYSVGQRRREIGIRLALGASPWSVGRMVVVEGLKVTGAGMVAGVLIALLLGQMAASILFGVTPTDLTTFVAVAVVVLVVAVLASWAPALRAMHVDPAGTLKAE